MIHRYTLFGSPIEQSLSPKIHTLFAEQVQRRLTYTASLATIENFFQASGADGCNVTLPLKEEALKLCNRLNEAARVAGSVNTIKSNRFYLSALAVQPEVLLTHCYKQMFHQSLSPTEPSPRLKSLLNPLLLVPQLLKVT